MENKMIENEYSIRTVKIVNYSAFALTVCIVMAVFIGAVVCRHNRTFSTEHWIAHPDERAKMVDDMLGRHDLAGKTKAEVTKILGEETKHSHFKKVDNLVYRLGAERALAGIDSKWLVITFFDDVVMSVEIL
jgi:hypothetical protein